MPWRKTISLLLPILALASNALAAEGYILGFGLEGDTEEGLAVTAIGDVELTENTWLTAAIARNMVDLPRRQTLDTWYADIGLDHLFDPVGIRLGVAYWGDSDILDSIDWRGSLYWRNDKVRIAADYEFRDFDFELPAFGAFPGRAVNFDANGIGLSVRFDLTDNTSLNVYGMDYDYSIDLSLDRNQGIIDLLTFSRMSLINSLVDYQVGAGLGVDVGTRRWQFELGTWKGEIDGSVTNTATLRFMTPMGEKSDVEFGLGVDNSELYGTVTFLSVYLFFYGGT